MPVNSFENYYMSWKPEKNQLKYPIYVSLADKLEADINNGILKANTKLPPQRELADFLDVNLTTVTRAFKICQLKGLIYAVTGKGTFVASLHNPQYLNKKIDSYTEDKPLDDEIIDMALMNPFYSCNSLITETVQSITCRKDFSKLMEYGIPNGTLYHRKCAKKWLQQFNTQIDEENIAITCGSQHALLISLISLFTSGDKIAVDEYTYLNFIRLANSLNIQLIPIKNDECGMIPEVLDKQCKLNNIKGIYLMSSCNNPTNIILNMNRRKELAHIIKKHNLILIEDDIYSFLNTEKLPPISALLPNQSIYINGISKSICAGLRVGFISFPSDFKLKIINNIYDTNLNTSLLNVEIVSELINNGIASIIMNKKIDMLSKRGLIYEQYFPSQNKNINKLGFHRWLKLPENLDSEYFELLAQKHNVHVLSSTRFSIGKYANNNFIRLMICSPKDNSQLERGLEIIKNLLEKSNNSNDLFII